MRHDSFSAIVDLVDVGPTRGNAILYSAGAIVRGMRTSVPGLLGLLFILCGLVATQAEEPDGGEEPTGAMARLEGLGILFECRRMRDSFHVNARDVTDAAEVEYIRLFKQQYQDSLPRLPEAAFDVFPLFPKLRAIRLDHILLDAVHMKRLKEIPHLRSLWVHGSRHRDHKSFAAPADLDFLAGVPDLECLGLTSCGLTDDMIAKLLPLKSLKRLDLRWNGVTHGALPVLRQLPALETVSLHDTGFAPPPMEARRFAAQLKSLQYHVAAERYSLEDLQEIMTLPRHTWTYGHNTDVPLAEIAGILPGPVRYVSSGSWNNEIKLHGIDEAGETFVLKAPR